MKRSKLFFLILWIHLPLFISQVAGQVPPKPPPPEVVLEGAVRDPSGQSGLPGVTLRLTPPNSVNSPVRLVRADQKGNFRFADPKNLYHGKHLLEVYQGTDLLFRKEIDTQQPQNRRILVRVRPAF
jgi:hypothetical protein